MIMYFIFGLLLLLEVAVAWIFLSKILALGVITGKATKFALVIVALLIFPVAWFLGFVVGGTWGGAIASAALEVLGSDHSYMTLIGVGLGAFAVTMVTFYVSISFFVAIFCGIKLISKAS